MFAGIGGFRLGIIQAAEELNIKTECVFSSEIEKNAIAIYNKNFGEMPSGDITTIRTGDVASMDVLCGGFPCQAFSIAGNRAGFKDARGTLFFEIARDKRPKILFLENVKGLLNHDKGRTFAVILLTLDELGYDVEWQVLNSKDFGVPQNRGMRKTAGISRWMDGRNHRLESLQMFRKFRYSFSNQGNCKENTNMWYTSPLNILKTISYYRNNFGGLHMARSKSPIANSNPTPTKLYRVENRLGCGGKEFVKDVQKMYKENKDKLKNVDRPTTIKAAIAVAKKLGRKVYYKEEGMQWVKI